MAKAWCCWFTLTIKILESTLPLWWQREDTGAGKYPQESLADARTRRDEARKF